MAHEPNRMRSHSDNELTLKLTAEEVVCLDTELTDWNRTARVEVNVTYTDENGTAYIASRIIKMRLKKELYTLKGDE